MCKSYDDGLQKKLRAGGSKLSVVGGGVVEVVVVVVVGGMWWCPQELQICQLPQGGFSIDMYIHGIPQQVVPQCYPT